MADEAKILSDIRSIITKSLSPEEYQIFLFGSRATGVSRARSDFDIGLYSYTHTAVPVSTLMHIKDEIDEYPTLYKIEIIDLSTTSSEFRELALRSGKELI